MKSNQTARTRRSLGVAFGTAVTVAVMMAAVAETRVRGQEPRSVSARQVSVQQRGVLDALSARDRTLGVSWNDRDGIPSALRGQLTAPSPETAQTVARTFLRDSSALFGIGNVDGDLRLARSDSDAQRITHLRYAQIYKGVPVFGSEIRVHVDAAGVVGSTEAELLPGIAVATDPLVPAAAALEIAKKDLGDRSAVGASTLTVFDPGRLTRAGREDHLAWVLSLAGAASGRWVYFVDALSGDVIFKYDDRQTIRDRRVYSHDGSACNLGQQLYNESGPVVGNPGADATSAYNFAADVYGYYASTHGRDSYDGGGSAMLTAVNWNDQNAEWDPNCRRTRFGTGWAVKDVVGHEWQHGVTQFTANLVYSCEPGALNESFSDVFGAMIDRDDWLMGEDLSIGAIRSLSDPPSHGQPDTVNGYNPCAEVHTNSGIPNKVAFLLSDGGTHYGVSVAGVGRGSAEGIWFRALSFHMGSGSDFNSARNATIDAAAELFGGESAEVCSVKNAWASVAVGAKCVTLCTLCPRVALQASNGQWLVAESGGGGPVYANRNAVGPWETFRLVDLGGGNIALQADNGQYVVAEGGGGGVVNANRDAIGGWETFHLIDLGGGNVALQASNGQYVVAEGGGGGAVNANRTDIGPWETFVLSYQ